MNLSEKISLDVKKIRDKFGLGSKAESDYSFEEELYCSKKHFESMAKLKKFFLKEISLYKDDTLNNVKNRWNIELGHLLAEYRKIVYLLTATTRESNAIERVINLQKEDFKNEESQKQTFYETYYKLICASKDKEQVEELTNSFINMELIKTMLIKMDKRDFMEFMEEIKRRRGE